MILKEVPLLANILFILQSVLSIYLIVVSLSMHLSILLSVSFYLQFHLASWLLFDVLYL